MNELGECRKGLGCVVTTVALSTGMELRAGEEKRRDESQDVAIACQRSVVYNIAVEAERRGVRLCTTFRSDVGLLINKPVAAATD